ncbi:hydroxylamine oxidase [Puniceicoccales bacterium CK1056]|uniref:Hydroxylamine oxidase n=1 Tax=Oceanipulchritudo coccoides TaxID=2706888 RepID=A0A6B2M0S3_9BACT|nr:multiheme c-type cytochrome [Oceanipulchritudo coccoides]NDV61704.1 hydroxylamine oxidase [Oceanipulchritudo coccoides]
MKTNRIAPKILLLSGLTLLTTAALLSAEMSPETEECLMCHEMATPGIVGDWQRSRHARFSPMEAMGKDPLERRISAGTVPENMASSTIGCYECHGLNTGDHADAFEHFGYTINLVVSPKDCATCHPDEQHEYNESKKAHAIANLRDNPVYHALETEVIGMKVIDESGVQSLPPSAHTAGESCYACHGTVLTVDGLKTIDTDFGEIEIPNIANWPNQGVGRINPDGSRGACTACHPRHGFSIEVARKPYTCAQCHVEPDVPAWDVWKESKHGNILLSETSHYNWDAVPWKAGEDFNAPSCSVCHNALVTDPSGDEVIANRTHDFGSRLWLRIFGLVTSHPQPAHGLTTTLLNDDGQPMPVTFTGVHAKTGLISPDEMDKRQAMMSAVCRACHSTDWVNGHFEQFDLAVAEIDEMVIKTNGLMQQAWDLGLADPANPFDESLEHQWVKQWLINANAARYASAMNGQDFAAFKYGWWGLSQTVVKFHEQVSKVVQEKE